MYNVEMYMYQNGLSKKDVANFLGIQGSTLSAKLKKQQPFKLDEAFAIKNKYFANMPVEYLFSWKTPAGAE